MIFFLFTFINAVLQRLSRSRKKRKTRPCLHSFKRLHRIFSVQIFFSNSGCLPNWKTWNIFWSTLNQMCAGFSVAVTYGVFCVLSEVVLWSFLHSTFFKKPISTEALLWDEKIMMTNSDSLVLSRKTKSTVLIVSSFQYCLRLQNVYFIIWLQFLDYFYL